MESALALKLGEMLKDCEKRERAIQDKEATLESREKAVLASLEAQAKRGEELREESSRYQNFRDIAEERRRNEDQARKNAQDAAVIADERDRWAKEQSKSKEEVRRELEESRLWKERLAGEQKLLETEKDDLRKEKIAHRDRVISELAEIKRKGGSVNGV